MLRTKTFSGIDLIPEQEAVIVRECVAEWNRQHFKLQAGQHVWIKEAFQMMVDPNDPFGCYLVVGNDGKEFYVYGSNMVQQVFDCWVCEKRNQPLRNVNRCDHCNQYCCTRCTNSEHTMFEGPPMATRKPVKCSNCAQKIMMTKPGELDRPAEAVTA